jgi:hypothetical protein
MRMHHDIELHNSHDRQLEDDLAKDAKYKRRGYHLSIGALVLTIASAVIFIAGYVGVWAYG